MKQIEQYNDAASYNSAGKPTTESRVANIKEGNISKFDGVNVPTTDTPMFGDAVYLDENGNKVAIRQDVYNRSLVPASWTYKGVFLGYHKDGRWRTFLGNYSSLPSLKYCDVLQYQLNAPTLDGAEHTASIGLWLSNNSYASATTISFTYTATTLSQVVAALNAAIDAKKTEVSFNQDVWAYIADDDNNKVSTDADATKIIVQIDTWNDYRQYQIQGGTLIIWRDMPASDNYRKVNGKSTNYRGLMNFEGAASYWSTNGRTLSANVAVHSEAGNTDPMKLTEFQSSPYAAEIRAYYKTYEAYLRGEFGIQPLMKVGAFALPDGEALTAKYGPMMAPTKSGGTKAIFPSLNWAYNQGGHLWDVMEGVLMMEDSNLAVINATQTKAGKLTLANSSYRWWAQRYYVYGAWVFYGTNRYLYFDNVRSTFQVGAVSLLK
jgi:hypothetical protein